MAAANKAVDPSALEALYVFNGSLGDEDTEGNKILYFFPDSVPINTQKDYVGISEGLIGMTKYVCIWLLVLQA
jgi:hypothetical protein